MSEIAAETSNEEQSPRSTVLLTDSITGGVIPGIMSDGSLASPEDKVDSAEKGKDTNGNMEDPLSPLPSAGGQPKGRKQLQYRESERATPTTPLPYEYSYTSYSSVTPQQQRSAYGYTTGYPLQTPEPASPATHGPIYDVNSFLQPMGAFHTGSNFLSGASPSRMTPIPPPSPLFPRASTTGGVESGQPPVLPYMSPHLGSNGVAPAYSVSYPSPRQDSWNGNNGDRNANKAYLSPQVPNYLSHHGGARQYAFEESMLPPPAVEDQSANPAYSPYAGSQGSAYSMVSSWPYGGPGDPYSGQNAPHLQPRPSTAGAMGLYPPAAGGGRGMYGQYYPSTSPGPPIQTTACNKGPDGANLFIFHIPNHFTNIDMFQLFDPYGTLLSVRIMVEKDTGRSRGFGFVSYDSPESAALAIKELNGFAIGNKRLKVQHKQIRRDPDSGASEVYDGGATGYHAAPDGGTSYPPPSASGAPGEMWFDTTTPVNESVPNIKPVPASPLESLGQLHDALPDIPGNPTVVDNKLQEEVVVEPQQPAPEEAVVVNDICC